LIIVDVRCLKHQSIYQGGIMADKENYKVAIDILCCHLGMSVDEAHKELGLDASGKPKLTNTQEALIGLTGDNS
jgi:hypothetical protein